MSFRTAIISTNNHEGKRYKAKPSNQKHRNRQAKGEKFAMNETKATVSEYHIGHTIYR